ncbi:MAG: hypothetical protein M1280_05165 [Actinobacteria bacterium]|nr:hypothetical protein [Actinomycetota bacterium]
MTLSGKSGVSSGKAEDEGVAGSYVEDENAARGVIWLAGTHGYLRDTTLGTYTQRRPMHMILQSSEFDIGSGASSKLCVQLQQLCRRCHSQIPGRCLGTSKD